MPTPRLTHFLCLPLATQQSKPQLQQSLQAFAAVVTSKYDVQPKAIRPVGTIHLTLGVMQLSTKEQVEAACAFLKALDIVEMLKESALVQSSKDAEAASPPDKSSADGETVGAAETREALAVGESLSVPESQTIILPPPLSVSMSGLESMHSPTKTSILYTSPTDPTSRLTGFALSLRDAFTSVNILVPEKRPLRLHATIVNTLYAKTKGRGNAVGHGTKTRAVEKFDATTLLEEFHEFEWAKAFCIEKVSICEMGAKKEIIDGDVVNEEYTEIASVLLP